MNQARAERQEDGAGVEQTFVTFVLCGSRMALPASETRFVVPLVDVNPVPGAPAFVYGTARLRGESIPVLDVAARFGLPPVELSSESHLLVVRADEAGSVALVSDELPGIQPVSDEGWTRGSAGLLPPGMNHWARFIAGSIRLDRHQVPVISLDKLLDPEEADLVQLVLPDYAEPQPEAELPASPEPDEYAAAEAVAAAALEAVTAETLHAVPEPPDLLDDSEDGAVAPGRAVDEPVDEGRRSGAEPDAAPEPDAGPGADGEPEEDAVPEPEADGDPDQALAAALAALDAAMLEDETGANEALASTDDAAAARPVDEPNRAVELPEGQHEADDADPEGSATEVEAEALAAALAALDAAMAEDETDPRGAAVTDPRGRAPVGAVPEDELAALQTAPRGTVVPEAEEAGMLETAPRGTEAPEAPEAGMLETAPMGTRAPGHEDRAEAPHEGGGDSKRSRTKAGGAKKPPARKKTSAGKKAAAKKKRTGKRSSPKKGGAS